MCLLLRRGVFVWLLFATILYLGTGWVLYLRMTSWISRNRWPFTTSSITTSWRQIQVLPTVSPNCGPGVIVPKGEFVRVKGTTTLLVSAFREHRTETKEVRIIAISERRKKFTYLCVLCCEGQIYTSEGINKILTTHYSFAYGPSHLMCPVLDSCETPSHISAVSTEDKFTKGRQFLKVENLEPRTEAFPHNFTVCISAMFEFSNVLQMVQSFEMLKLLGVTRMVIYKTSASPETELVLDYNTQTGFVEVITWRVTRFLKVSRSWTPLLDPGDIHYFGQLPALNDCVYRSMYQTRYLALHDVDELILPQTVSSWVELLPLLEWSYGADRCYAFQNNLFPNNVILAPPNYKTLHPDRLWPPRSELAPGINILVHLYHEPQDWNRFSRCKLITNPRGVISPGVHDLEEAEFSCVHVDRNVARMYHTRPPLHPKLLSKDLIYDGRLLDYSSRLIPAVNTTFVKARETLKKP